MGSRSALRLWLLAFVAFTAGSCAWALTVPILSAPDEHNHVIKAAGVVRGQPLGHMTRYDEPPYEADLFELPEVYGQAPEQFACYIHRPDVPADCAPPLVGAGPGANVASSAGEYPPLYYGLVGLPSLVLPATGAIYGMRVVSAALSGAFLASALLSLLGARWRRALVVGLAAAVTPTVTYLAGMVNPNRIEITSAICLWA